ncbi:MAG: glutamate--tRNA ligase [Candidatus Micrarchaeota archaeon]|nr:glutamate--tRNA ligase [Candidatus Micrarchaeota archaeon]
MVSEEILSAIRKYAIKNAIEYGKANDKSVLGKILSQFPDAKSDMRQLNSEIAKIVAEVNSMGKADLEAGFSQHKEEFSEAQKKKAEESVPKFVLEGAVAGQFATRFPPEPGGYMHIGHAKVSFMEREFADIYKGTLALFFDDTNPEKESQEFVDQFKEDLKWLGIKFDREYYSSDHMEQLYGYAERLIRDKHAYVCMCSGDTIKQNRTESISCEHRAAIPNKNLELWKKMVSGGFEENGAVLRLRGDLKSLNTVMRDPVLFRIKRQPHYRQGTKYSAWPTYDFNTPIIDSLEGITDAMRSKEYELRDELYYRLLDLLELRKPRVHSVARLEIKDNITSKRETTRLIKEGFLMGYDDPRLITIASLRRRGIVPEAIKKFVMRFGMSKVNSIVDISMLIDENRRIVDKTAKHLFFVEEPVRLKVEGMDSFEAKMRFGSENPSEYRSYKVGNNFYIGKKDSIGLKNGDRIRLKDLFNVEVSNSKGDIIAKHIGDQGNHSKVVQWVSEGNCSPAKLLIPGRLLIDGEFNKDSLTKADGLVEDAAKSLREGEIVQLERVGFFRLDNKDEMLFIGS